jgi:hypothetical protein
MRFETPVHKISFLYQDTIRDSRLIRILYFHAIANPKTQEVSRRLREFRNSVSTCNLVTETELQLLFIGMINSERVNNVTS